MSKRSVLILDDSSTRHDVYDKIYEGCDVRHAYDYFDFLSALDRGSPWDLVHLDHDLGDLVAHASTYVDGWGSTREYNGQHASLRICELSDERLPKRVIVQSVNPEGARAMKMNLVGRGVDVSWQPFGDPMQDGDQAVSPEDTNFT